jgi:hypothetical protein
VRLVEQSFSIAVRLFLVLNAVSISARLTPNWQLVMPFCPKNPIDKSRESECRRSVR